MLYEFAEAVPLLTEHSNTLKHNALGFDRIEMGWRDGVHIYADDRAAMNVPCGFARGTGKFKRSLERCGKGCGFDETPPCFG